MLKMSKEYLKEMRNLERQANDLTSQYTDLEKIDVNDYKKVVNANVNYAPHKGETWKEYSGRVRIYAKINADKNRLTHIDGPRKAWYTHRNPQGCFMCEDINLISLMCRVIDEWAIQYPDNRF